MIDWSKFVRVSWIFAAGEEEVLEVDCDCDWCWETRAADVTVSRVVREEVMTEVEVRKAAGPMGRRILLERWGGGLRRIFRGRGTT